MISGIKSNILGSGLKVLTSLIINVILTRTLDSSAFGLFATIMIVQSLLVLLVESGLGSSIIQFGYDKERINFIFTLQLIVAVSLGLFTFFFSGVIFGDGENLISRTALLLFILSNIIQSLSQIPLAVMKRDLKFSNLQFYNNISYIFGFGLFSIFLSYLGMGILSLIFGIFTQSIMMFFFLIGKWPHKPKPNLDFKNNMLVINYSKDIIAANGASWLLNNLDIIILRRLTSLDILGNYNRANSIILSITSVLVSSVQSVIFSFSSKNKNDLRRLYHYYSIVYCCMVSIIFYILVFFANNSSSIISLLYGNNWLYAEEFMPFICLSSFLFSAMAFIGPLFNGINLPKVDLKSQSISAIIGLMVFAVLLLCKSASVFVILGSFCFVQLLRLLILLKDLLLQKVMRINDLAILSASMFVFAFLLYISNNLDVSVYLKISIQVFLVLVGISTSGLYCVGQIKRVEKISSIRSGDI